MKFAEDVVLMIKMASDYQHGHSLRQISKRYRVSYTKTRRLLKQAGIEFRPQGRNEKWTR